MNRGTGPLRAQLDVVTRALEKLTEVVNQLRLGYESLARGNERIIMSLSVMRVDYTKMFEALDSKMDSARLASRTAAAAS